MSQRGGDVQSNLRISSDEILSDLIPQGAADIIISLEPMEALRYVPYLKSGGLGDRQHYAVRKHRQLPRTGGRIG